MGDLYFGLLVLAALSAALFGVGRTIGRRVSTPAVNRLSALTVVVLIAYIACVWDQTSLVRWLPYSNLIVLGNWFPFEAALLGGLASAQSSMPVWRRGLTVTAL
ncbi:MAG: hypothetical protein IAG10_34990 [Planctomycetaceae bacterium]|nr:hypothetical protein [Planctomycetaceae bacterium]